MTSLVLLPFRPSVARMGLAPEAPRSPVQQSTKPSLFRRVVEAVAQSNQRKAERVVAAYVARHAGALARDLEQTQERSSP